MENGKQITKKGLPLNVQYTCIDKKYIALFDGGGCICENCGRAIANIATVKSENGVYNIGFDCLETFLLNNALLDGFDVAEYEATKKQISQILRLSKSIKKTISESSANITGLAFVPQKYKTDFFPFYWLCNGQNMSRDNDYLKAKGIAFDFLIQTLKGIFTNISIITIN